MNYNKIITFLIILILCLGFGIFLIPKKNAESNMINFISENILDNSIYTQNLNTSADENVQIVAIENTAKENNIPATPKVYEGKFELPLNGTTAYASVTLPLYRTLPNSGSSKDNVISNLKPGRAFKILDESSGYFYAELSDSTTGWIESKYCLVNLPDLIPSIIYDNTNSYSSIFRSSGYDLENITNKCLYDVRKYNTRLNKNEYIMPLLYPMVEKIAKVQKEALKNDDCLKIYETFRPYEVQMNVSNSLTKLMESNKEVSIGINSAPWNKSWFIATQLSNHQRGIALDVSLVKVQSTEYNTCGSYTYLTVSKYEEYKMPTKMHELSKSAATFTSPVSSKSKTDWKKAKLASSMTDGAIKLQNYFTSFGLTPLASEWWHFNDLDTRELTQNNGSNGKFYLTDVLSTIPTV